MVLGTAKLRHRKSTMWRTMRGKDVSKGKFWWNSRSFPTRPSISWFATSKLAGPRTKCIEMDKLAQEDHSYRLSREEYLRYQKHWYLTLNKSGKNTPMRLRSDFRAAITIMNRLHQESGEERAEPIPFQQVSKMAPFFLKWFLVELGHVEKLVELMSSIHF